LKEGRKPNNSDYKDFKISAENIGFQLLKKLGWQEGSGLGKSGQGIQEPVNKCFFLYFDIRCFLGRKKACI
jgi:splicing factor 4